MMNFAGLSKAGFWHLKMNWHRHGLEILDSKALKPENAAKTETNDSKPSSIAHT